ncbi:MAG: Na/Pi cotransporter family protein, partial [Bacteroidia bacterium]|nr:Na/Pi cotransporter family protein [Bacteroidia bacterium]
IKPKKVVKRSQEPFNIDVRELYSTKVKNIYGKIIRYATKAQTSLDLTEDQNNSISQVKVANRKMVEVLRDVKELGKNVTYYLNSDNQYIQKEYDKFRKQVVKVLRMIYLFRKDQDNEIYYEKLQELKREAKANIHQDNLRIDKLIRKDLISVDMASSLVNDTDNVNDMIKNLIQVAELLYGKKDTLLVESSENKKSA